jgi:hypothetical protein
MDLRLDRSRTTPVEAFEVSPGWASKLAESWAVDGHLIAVRLYSPPWVRATLKDVSHKFASHKPWTHFAAFHQRRQG